MKLDLDLVEETAKTLYIRALKVLPDDIKDGIARLHTAETNDLARRILATMRENIEVAEKNDNLLCQDTGMPIYTITLGRGIETDGADIVDAIRRGTARATKEHPLRSSVVHPISRANEHTSCGRRVPVVNIEFADQADYLRIDMVPKGSGSENGSFLKMCIPAEGVAGIKNFVVEKVAEVGGRVCPPTIVGVGVGGTSDLCMHLAKIAATRPLGTACDDPEGAALEIELSDAVNALGVGPQGLGGDGTAFRVHVETAATHITMNPVAVNVQCHSARRASATFHADGFEFGF